MKCPYCGNKQEEFHNNIHAAASEGITSFVHCGKCKKEFAIVRITLEKALKMESRTKDEEDWKEELKKYNESLT